jgi:DNA-binding transcriptional LysR family regulator
MIIVDLSSSGPKQCRCCSRAEQRFALMASFKKAERDAPPMIERRNVLTPEALAMMDTIARTGSFAAAARELGKVPSALTYSVRQLEDALDVLLFDRRSRQAQLTPAGNELLHEGRRLLHEIDAVANRVRRVASGWETQLEIVCDDIISQPTMFELIEAFCALRPDGEAAPATRLRLRNDVLAGTWEALVTGRADLSIGIVGTFVNPGGIEQRPLGDVRFVFAMAPHHPLSSAVEPIGDDELVRHRAIAVADTAQRLTPLTVHLLPGQDVLTVPSMRAKLEALLRGLGCGYVPEPLARPHLAAGHLVTRMTSTGDRIEALNYAWRAERGPLGLGHALRWWLDQLESPTTQRALLERHAGRLL